MEFLNLEKIRIPTKKMDSRKLAALLSSLVSELLLILFLTFDSSTPLSLTNPNPNPKSNLFTIIHHFISSQELAAALTLLTVSRKRKRTHLLDFDPEPSVDELGSGFKPDLGQNPDLFKSFFKMRSSSFEWLSGLLEPLLECRDPAGSRLDLSAELRLAVGLFRLSTGSDYPEIARRFGVSESVARFCSKQLCRVLCTNYRFWVGFPNPGELESVCNGFQVLTGLPNCCGVIGCARFQVGEGGETENSIAAQIVVDSEFRILSIAAGFRGQKGDWEVLKSSSLYKDIEGGRLLGSTPIDVNEVAVNQYLVGNGDYPLLQWLMVPFVDAAPGSCEESFNAAHGLMRGSAVKAIASLRSWGVLSRPIQEEFKTAVAYVAACAMLHNVLLTREDYSALSDCFEEKTSEKRAPLRFGDVNLNEETVEAKGSVARSVLAARTEEFCKSKRYGDPSCSVQM